MKLKVDYICALTNLYGHVRPEKVCEVYNQLNNDCVELENFEAFLTNHKQVIENRYVYIKEGRFIEETLYLFEDKYEKLCAIQAGKPLKNFFYKIHALTS